MYVLDLCSFYSFFIEGTNNDLTMNLVFYHIVVPRNKEDINKNMSCMFWNSGVRIFFSWAHTQIRMYSSIYT